MTELTFERFTEQALRTESKVNEVQINIEDFKNLLKLQITVGTLLDYMKKGIFYNNYTKYDANYDQLMNDLYNIVTNAMPLSPGERIVQDNPPNYRVVHGLLGAVTESAEIAEHLLKYVQDGTLDKAGIGEEFSDHDWYKAITFDELVLDENVCRQNVINKLRIRFPDAYNDEAAASRDLTAERKELEKNL